MVLGIGLLEVNNKVSPLGAEPFWRVRLHFVGRRLMGTMRENRIWEVWWLLRSLEWQMR